ncbi:ATP-binding protein [Brevundimonas sp.]|uniref:ATP-binding protein n=1 Tax=Brevundimonas sp. TaxID=1871086 RepID=UPI003AF9037A
MAKLNIRARAVDLLGRQQVANIPTALSELFKNAHDAYADRVEIDFYRARSLLILRDDGVGMSTDDFETRWLTIGTESKAQGSLNAPPVDPKKPLRPVMGEKGIGRLAIALVGTQVLVLTRPKFGVGTDTLTAAFIHWGLFALPGVDLSDIEIPVIKLPAGTAPSAADVRGMVDAVRANVSNLISNPAALQSILKDLDAFDLDPAALHARLPDGPDILRTGGSQFWIHPVNEILADNIDGANERYKATPFEKVLLGFSNTMTPGHAKPAIEARFRDHQTDGTWTERIAEDNFLTPAEFASADHHIQGQFDRRGQFTGTVQIYGKEPIDYQVRWPGAGGKDTLCGPVRINFCYLQGSLKDSRLPKEEFDRLAVKLNKIGGLYIYRDGIRVLPYGDADYDFLDIEGRRTRSAGYYFFSYRRMIGVIEISRKDNDLLVEKAGREGFQENRAYRQMKEMLEHFFVQAAGDFFREDGAMADVWQSERERLVKEHELLAKRSRQVAGKRAALAKDLEGFFEKINGREFEASAEAIVSGVRLRLESAQPGDLNVNQLMTIEKEARDWLSELRDDALIRRPRGVGLTRELSRAWARYEVEQPRLEAEHFRPAFATVERLVSQAADRLDLNLTPRQRMTALIEDLGTRERRRAKSAQSDIQRNLAELRERALDYAREGFLAVETTIRSTLIELEQTGGADMSEVVAQATRERLETSIVSVADEQIVLMERLREQLKAAATPEALEQDDIMQAVEGELEERRERDLESLQLAQMGAAIGIVHHEFAAVIRSVRQNIRQLRTWAAKNPKLDTVYRDIRDSYTHLDGYLSLFAPLNRRLRRERRAIRGVEIYNYLDQLFGTRMEQKNVLLNASPSFMDSVISDYPANIFPAFVNLVDNAIYWLSQSSAFAERDEPESARPVREIRLDFTGDAFLVSDNGPGILAVDRDAIFHSGFSRKPGGSGLGLYITKSLLEQAGYAFDLAPASSLSGATFKIGIPDDALIDNNDTPGGEEEE